MTLVHYIKSLFEPNYISQYDEELKFSISIGENCEIGDTNILVLL